MESNVANFVSFWSKRFVPVKKQNKTIQFSPHLKIQPILEISLKFLPKHSHICMNLHSLFMGATMAKFSDEETLDINPRGVLKKGTNKQLQISVGKKLIRVSVIGRTSGFFKEPTSDGRVASLQH